MPTLSSSFKEEDDPRKSNAPRRKFCDLIVREGGDYCMQLKGNQGAMQADIRAFLADSAQATATLIRGLWEIENSVHWSLDVVMNDDQHRARKDNAPANVAALRRVALGIIKANTAKGSNRVKVKKAG